MKTINNHSVFLFLTVVTVFFLSLIFGSLYVNGDQTGYIKFYNQISQLNMYDGFAYYNNSLDSREPVYFIISWFFSNLGVHKLYYITFINVILSYFTYKYIAKFNVPAFLVFILITLNFYSYVILFAAERLKFALLFIVIALYYEKSKKSIFFTFLSLLSHSQVIILFISVYFVTIKKELSDLLLRFKATKSFILRIALVLFASALLFLILKEHLISKFYSYFYFREPFEFIKISIFFLLSLYYSKNKVTPLLFFAPMYLFVFLFGGERLNFMGYYGFLYFSFLNNRGLNLGVLLTTVYFIYTGFSFLFKVIEHGDGFVK